MECRIWSINRFINIKPEEAVSTTKRVHSFCTANGLADRLFRSQGGWYILKRDGTLSFTARTLTHISFEELYKLLNEDKR